MYKILYLCTEVLFHYKPSTYFLIDKKVFLKHYFVKFFHSHLYESNNSTIMTILHTVDNFTGSIYEFIEP